MTVPVTTTLFGDGYWDDATRRDAAARSDAAVHRVRLPGGVSVWVIVSYDEARAALTDPRLSKDIVGLRRILRRQYTHAGHGPQVSRMFSPHMLFADPPTHTRLRRLVAAQFTRPRVDALRPHIERITADLLHGLPRGRPVDLMAEVAFLLPLTVICELLGVPVADRGSFRAWTRAMMGDHPADTVPASEAMADYFMRLIAAKRARPANDLLSALVHASYDGDVLTQEELLGTLFLLFIAGHETTAGLIGNAARWLMADRRLWRDLGADSALVSAAIDEMLRYDAPVRMATHRYTREPVTYAGTTIPADELVLVGLAAANRDPRRFDCADTLDIRRDVTGHLGFGYGIHHCLGASLGKLEADIALTMLTRRYPRARLAVPATRLTRQRSAIINSYVALPVLLGPP